MHTLFKYADDLVYAALFAVAIGGIFLAVEIDDGHPLVSSGQIVVTEPSKVDRFTPTRATKPELYAARDTNHPR